MNDAPSQSVDRTDHSMVGVFLRGMLMGAADIVPGVSGGTMAFITGIYHRLIAAISAVDPRVVTLVLRGRIGEAWKAVDGNFLLALGAGIGVSIVSLARLITWLLESHPLQLWAFFFGLILASAIVLIRHVDRWGAATVLGLLAGAATASLIGLSPSFSLPVSAVSFFLAGFIAICAMILPGVSGSFILVLLGMYEPVLAAVRGLELVELGLFMTGAVCGLLVFTRALNMLLQRFHAPTLATLTGFLLGSLPVVWPWRLEDMESGAQQPVWPDVYLSMTAQDPAVLACLGFMLIGLIAVWVLETRWGGLER